MILVIKMKNENFEKRIFGWKLVKKVMCHILQSDKKDSEEKLYFTWIFLNKYVHPSAKQLNMDVSEDFAGIVTDSINERLARYSLEIIDEIFDIIYAIIF